MRDLSKGRDDRDAGVPMWRAFDTGRAWLIATLLRLLAFVVVAGAILLGPPALECRQRAQTGFFSGDTLLRCVGEATNQRLRSLENWVNTLVRGSGT